LSRVKTMARWASILAVFPATIEAFKSMENSTMGNLDPNRILCPVLASLYNSGDLKVDSFGIAERAQIKSALKDGTWVSADFAEFQSAGISDYDFTHKFDQNSRDRCAPLTLSGAACQAKWLAGKDQDKDVKRYLNIFEMNGLETVEHGFSTGVRGGNCNSRLENDLCDGQYPCEALFQKFYAAHADSQGRIYRSNILEIICHTIAEGDRGGEFAYFDGEVEVPFLPGVKLPARHWQMKAAMQGWLSAFGQFDENGDAYFTVADARAMLMEGRMPDGWQKRRWGCVTSIGGCPTMPDGKPDMGLLDQALAHLPCSQFDAWWGGSETTVTGQSCRSDSSCSDAHALCLNKRCTCGKGRNGLQMLYKQNPTSSNSCQEQDNPRKYFGETCRYQRADAPDSPSVWASSIVV